jgi:hypothetical protein
LDETAVAVDVVDRFSTLQFGSRISELRLREHGALPCSSSNSQKEFPP